MGGDHQCPVCQSTFTRPQHVARHMRSHTGDRPYKCQYCGDQFARSDLLSRHVNKCHANEKQPQTATTGRRKGSASASRATTSKQACDQCVQSSLPCDGCNPCTKCMQRKSRCTYVKFHRQTAPSGPGHHIPRPPSTSTSLPNGNPRIAVNDFILGPLPVSVPSMPTSSGDPLYNNAFSFNHAYASSTNPLHLPISVSSDADMSARNRAQAELLRQAGSSILANSQGSASGLCHALYADPNQSSNQWLTWDDGTNPPLTTSQTSPPHHYLDDSAFSQNQYGADGIDNFSSEMFTGSFIGSAYRPRRDSFDCSDGSSASHSIPSSATSSNVHLPLPGGDMYQGASEDFQQRMLIEPQDRGESASSSVHEFHGVPFFSSAAMNMQPHSPNATPMPPKALSQLQQRDRGMSLSSLPTPGDVMWRAFLHTPMIGGVHATNSEAAGVGRPQSPSGRRRARVSSLPSSTPTVERTLLGMANNHGDGSSAMRVTSHGNGDDLRSYEAAVNARNASLHLNLVPKRRGTRPSHSTSPPAPAVPGVPGTDCRIDTTQSLANGNYDSRPSSSSSTSSLAQAFVLPHAVPVKGAAPAMNGMSISLPVPRMSSMGSSGTEMSGSRESSVGSEGTGSSEGEAFRPSFKRLPSQTLGPANAKRAQIERDPAMVGSVGVVHHDIATRSIAALPEHARQTSNNRRLSHG